MKQIKTGEKTIHLIDGKKVTNHVLVGEDDRYVTEDDIFIPSHIYEKICMYIEKDFIDFMGIS